MGIKLKGGKVYRGGVTARSVTVETRDIEVRNPAPGKGVYNIFELASKGGGATHVEYVYDASDYPAHLQMMVENDRNAALAAMSEIMRKEMVSLPAREAVVAQAARREIVTAAHNRWASAFTHGTDEAVANIVRDGVNAIVTAIEKPKTSGKGTSAGTVQPVTVQA
jgi:hypothetical protein